VGKPKIFKKNMNILKPIQLLITAVILLIFSSSLFSQKLAPKERILAPNHTITSNITRTDYQLYISFPRNYSTKDSISYPVLYVLDGEIAFPLFSRTKKLFQVELIIVGIGTSNRYLDGYNNFTTSSSTSDDEKKMKKRNVKSKGIFKSGGADKFLESIKTEIIPFVEKNYKTNADRGIYGHALGGLFAAYCLVHSDGYFTRFGVSSPTFWWDNEKLLNQAVTQFTENKTWDLPQTKVYISVGGNEGPEMLPTMAKYCSNLENQGYDKINLKWQIFDEESHVSVWPANVSKTIYTLYGKNPN
jgi:predicted alpha/beta superfamily hydrolase